MLQYAEPDSSQYFSCFTLTTQLVHGIVLCTWLMAFFPNLLEKIGLYKTLSLLFTNIIAT